MKVAPDLNTHEGVDVLGLMWRLTAEGTFRRRQARVRLPENLLIPQVACAVSKKPEDKCTVADVKDLNKLAV